MPHWVRIAAFLFVTLLVVSGLNVFVYRRTRAAFELTRAGRVALGALLASGVPALLAGRFAARAPLDTLNGVAQGLTVYGAIVTIGALLTALLLAPLAMASGLARAARASWRGARAQRAETELSHAALVAEPSASAPSPTEVHGAARSPTTTDSRRREGALAIPRRRFLTQAATGGALLVGGGASFYGAVFGRHDYQLEEVPIRLAGLPKALDGYTLAQLSDVHIGAFVQEPELRAAEALLRRARPDLIVLTGDLLDHDPAYAPMLGAFVRRLGALARDGVVAIPGNHDYYAGIDAVLGSLRAAGARILVNEGEVIGGSPARGEPAFALLGVDDVWAPREGGRGPSLEAAIHGVPRDLPRVLLCHNPELFLEAAEHVDLQLSGHTHGGQINFIANSAELVFPHGYVRGHYRRGASQIYVNRGFGTAGPPSRIGSAPEVTRVVLVAG
jgi:predicted MPP superfamily phosphohydrolase